MSTTHLITGSKFLIGIHIDFDNRRLVTDFALELFKNGRLHFARTAPCCEEIDQSRLFTFDYFIKITHI